MSHVLRIPDASLCPILKKSDFATNLPGAAKLMPFLFQVAGMVEIRVWDAPLRVFHWLLAPAVAAALVTGEIGGNLMEWHGRCGLFILGLVTFRILWGLVGSTHARFLSFLPSPARLRAYLKGQWRGLGHNPLGALSVFGLLALLLLQAGTGLFANDDIAFRGPLARLVSDSLGDRLTGIHHLAATLLMAMVGLHLAAIVFYVRVKKQKLLQPMITGLKKVPRGEAAGLETARGGHVVALILAAGLASAAVWFIGSGRLVDYVAPQAPASTAPAPPPAW